MPGNFQRRRTGATVAELAVVMVLIGTMAAIAVPLLGDSLDRHSARAAIRETSALFGFARRSAITRRAVVAVVIDTASGSIIVRSGPTSLGRLALRDRYRVALQSSRDSMSYDPRGFGYGAANLSVVVRRGRASETLFVSRLGRARR